MATSVLRQQRRNLRSIPTPDVIEQAQLVLAGQILMLVEPIAGQFRDQFAFFFVALRVGWLQVKPCTLDGLDRLYAQT